MAVVGTLLYIAASIVFIWWVLGEAGKLGEGHGGQSHEQDQPQEPQTGPGEGDDLTVIRGIGTVIAPKLHQLGITTYQQVADLTESDIERIDKVLDFRGRIQREKWIEQAQEILNHKS